MCGKKSNCCGGFPYNAVKKKLHVYDNNKDWTRESRVRIKTLSQTKENTKPMSTE